MKGKVKIISSSDIAKVFWDKNSKNPVNQIKRIKEELFQIKYKCSILEEKIGKIEKEIKS